MTGDYTGIHYWNWCARRFGFRGALLHPQAVVGTCLSRLRAPKEILPRTLDLCFKGPVCHGCEVQLSVSETEDGSSFALRLAGDERPAILGCWSGGPGHGRAIPL